MESCKWPPPALSYATAVMCCVLFPVTLLGNFAIGAAVVVDPFRNLRTPFNYFLVNLAVSDLIIGVILLPFYVVVHVMEAQRTLPEELFSTMHILKFIATFASTLSIGALCFDRYAAVTWPYWYRDGNNVSRCLFMAAGIWAVSLALPWLYFAIRYIHFLMVFAHVALLTTLIVLVLTYVKVYRVLSTSVPRTGGPGERGTNSKSRKMTARDKQITRTLLIILATFVATYGPAMVAIYILEFCPSCGCVFRHCLRDFQNILILSNSAISAVVCLVRMNRVRNAAWAILSCRYKTARFASHSAPDRSSASVDNQNKPRTIKNKAETVSMQRSAQQLISAAHSSSAVTSAADDRHQRAVKPSDSEPNIMEAKQL